MSHLRRFIRRLVALVRFGRREAELSREVNAHLQLLEDEFVGQGMTRGEARYAAKRAFGGVEQAKEHQRDARGFRWLAGWPMDMKLGARMLVKSPGLSVIAVIALAVAFAAGASYLEFVNDMVRPRLAFAGGDRLVGITAWDIQKNEREARVLADVRTWRDEATLVELVGVSQPLQPEVTTDDGRAIGIDGVRMSAAGFRVVPATPLAGRPLAEADENPTSPPVAVIGEGLWESRFDSDPRIIGRSVEIDGVRHAIVGIMPKSFGFPRNQNLWVPFQDTRAALARGEGPPVRVFGRLREGTSLAAAQAELAALTARGTATAPASAGPVRVDVRPYVASLASSVGLNTQILALYAANIVFIALLAVCAANVATLVFGRTVTREAELTVRTALGASRGRIVSQLVAEAFVLASVAAVVGLSCARVVLRWVRYAWEIGQGSAMPFWWNETLGAETYLYTAALVTIAALMIGGIPALKATGPQMQGRLKQAGAGSTMTFGKLWTGIIVTQVAVTVVFLLGMVSLAWSVVTIQQQYVDVAFTRADYMTAWVANSDDDARPAAAMHRSREELVRRVSESPVVRAVSYTTRMPGVDQEDTPIEFDGGVERVRVAHVGPRFFDAFERPVIAGRDFTSREIASGGDVAIVDESFVRHVLGGRSAVGQRVRERGRGDNDPPGPWIEIVGVTADMSTSARKTLKDARVYRPIGASRAQAVNLVVHAVAGARAEGLPQVAEVLREAAETPPAGLRVSHISTLDSGGEGDVIEFVFGALGIVAAVALLLATAGIYALVSFTLARRTREIGIRTALGASPGRIVSGLLSKAMLQILLGVTLGALPGVLLVGSVSAAAGRDGLRDGSAVALGVALFVLVIAAVACSVPLRRALGIQPTQALRAQ